jgi:hypothetical protein
MAKRNYRKSSKKIQPAVLTMNFNVPVKGSTKEAFFLDLSQCASLVNRRFYRQGLNWAVSGFKFFSAAGSKGELQIQKLPNTWVMSNAWEKGFRHWMKMNSESLEAAESIKPKFLDFKIYANDDHHSLGYGANLLPLSGASLTLPVQQATAGEWVHSTFHIPNTAVASSDPTSNNPRSVIAVGPNYTATGADGQFAVSLVEGYAASRGLPDIEDPNTPTDATSINQSFSQNWLTALDNDFDQQTGEVIVDMTTENNISPYPFENDGVHTDTMYPGGANQMKTLEIHDGEFVTSTTIGGTTRIKGGNFPCGLVGVFLGNYDGEFLRMQVDLVPGSHRGYLAEPMTDM